MTGSLREWIRQNSTGGNYVLLGNNGQGLDDEALLLEAANSGDYRDVALAIVRLSVAVAEQVVAEVKADNLISETEKDNEILNIYCGTVMSIKVALRLIEGPRHYNSNVRYTLD
jgi:hypothetical protein